MKVTFFTDGVAGCPVAIGSQQCSFLCSLINPVLSTLSRLILNQFMAVGSRYGITSFSISPRSVRLQIWDLFDSSLTASPYYV